MDQMPDQITGTSAWLGKVRIPLARDTDQRQYGCVGVG
jgi:hypothetical protein